MNKYINRFKKNTKGIDYAVGDIHGSFSLLETKLLDIGFDPNTDRLFSVGDLIDRGTESHLVLEWLAKSWFYAIRGNHENMMIDYWKEETIPGYRGYNEGGYYPCCAMYNGGQWFLERNKEEQEKIIQGLESLPIVMTVETDNGRIGIVHADPGFDWEELEAGVGNDTDDLNMKPIDHAIWSRVLAYIAQDQRRDNTVNIEPIRNIHAVVVGHNVLKKGPQQLGNIYMIDTGACPTYGGKFTVLRLDTLEYV